MKSLRSIFALLVVCFYSGIALGAETLTLNQDIQLSPQGGTSITYSYGAKFEQEPDLQNDSPFLIGDGCEYVVRAQTDLVASGRFAITSDETTSPNLWLNRWTRTIHADLGNGGTILIYCRGKGFFNSLSDEYIQGISKDLFRLQ